MLLMEERKEFHPENRRFRDGHFIRFEECSSQLLKSNPGPSDLVKEERMFHIPVMVKEVFAILVSEGKWKEGVIIDGTVGVGGHLLYLVKNSPPSLKFLGIDIDPDAVAYCEDLFKGYKNVLIKQGDYTKLPEITEELSLSPVIGILIDCGVGRFQLEALGRGFSFRREAPLDMRFAQEGKTALELIRKVSRRELEMILREYGDVRYYRRIAKAIIENRNKIETTFDLNKVVIASLYGRGREEKTLRCVYMALRVAVNRELENLGKGIERAIPLLTKGGRIVVISYNANEDRLVKICFRERKAAKEIKIITAKPLTPSPEEIMKNPSSRSAKLRAAEVL